MYVGLFQIYVELFSGGIFLGGYSWAEMAGRGAHCPLPPAAAILCRRPEGPAFAHVSIFRGRIPSHESQENCAPARLPCGERPAAATLDILVKFGCAGSTQLVETRRLGGRLARIRVGPAGWIGAWSSLAFEKKCVFTFCHKKSEMRPKRHSRQRSKTGAWHRGPGKIPPKKSSTYISKSPTYTNCAAQVVSRSGHASGSEAIKIR